ncbi:hypothetical protein DSOUD_1478 [Desulfuromonas soudanensis]|uniref:Tetratricopeptide repeat protein n=1 Tax=Desulfuromonas soudanensis TaxID=1603606 RepID=A0A0M4DHI4_9BACT|nr:tetratricopeptide repeat protein [Desulfuromonas soudanensis]ALC16257.1 hypothetical protein DSOUD_1478 [Desulfuromonas soudanensis]
MTNHGSLLLRGIVAILLLIPASRYTAYAEADPSSQQIERYRQVLAMDSGNLPLHYSLGLALLLDNRTQEAIDEFRSAYPALTDSIEMNFNFGLACARLGDSDSALLYFEQAEALGALDFPEIYPLVNAYYNLGLTFLDADALDEAAGLFRRVLALDPSRVEIFQLLGDLHARQGAVDKAIESLTAYLDRYPEDAVTREYIFSLYFNEALKLLEKDEPKARSLFEKALASSPDSPLALYYLGYLDYRQDLPAAAVERLAPVYDRSPPELQESIRSILFNCALTLQERHQLPEAQRAIEALDSGEGDDPKVLFLAGNIALDLKDFIGARDNYEKVLAINPAHRGAILNLVTANAGVVTQRVERGRILYRRGEYASALRELDQALAINPADSRAKAYAREARIEVDRLASEHFTEGARALDEGNPKMAIGLARAGLALIPESPAGLALLEKSRSALTKELEQILTEGEGLLEKGALSQAKSAFDRALTLDPDHEGARKGKRDVDLRLGEQARAANDRGQRALDEGKLLEARNAFSEALTLQPGHPESLTGLARAEDLISTVVNEELHWGRRALSDGRFAQARERFANALRLEDSPGIRRELQSAEKQFSVKIEILLQTAKDWTNQENFKGARSLYLQILALDPRHGAATAGLKNLSGQTTAFIRSQQDAAADEMADGQFKEALRRYRQILDLDPSDSEARRGLNRGKDLLKGELGRLIDAGKSALEGGRFQEAEAALLQALALDPYNGQAQAVLTRVKSALPPSIAPEDPRKLYLQGIEWYSQGLYREAIAAWTRVPPLSPHHEKALLNIEKARRKLHQVRQSQGE